MMFNVCTTCIYNKKCRKIQKNCDFFLHFLCKSLVVKCDFTGVNREYYDTLYINDAKIFGIIVFCAEGWRFLSGKWYMKHAEVAML